MRVWSWVVGRCGAPTCNEIYRDSATVRYWFMRLYTQTTSDIRAIVTGRRWRTSGYILIQGSLHFRRLLKNNAFWRAIRDAMKNLHGNKNYTHLHPSTYLRRISIPCPPDPAETVSIFTHSIPSSPQQSVDRTWTQLSYKRKIRTVNLAGNSLSENKIQSISVKSEQVCASERCCRWIHFLCLEVHDHQKLNL